MASSGFHPTKASAAAGRRDRRAAKTAQPSTAAAARALRIQAAASSDSPAAAAIGSEPSVNRGPYTVVASRQSAPTQSDEGSPGNSSGASRYGLPSSSPAIRP